MFRLFKKKEIEYFDLNSYDYEAAGYRKMTEEELYRVNGGGWEEQAYKAAHEDAGDTDKTWMPEMHEETQNPQKTATGGNNTSDNAPTQDGDADSSNNGGGSGNPQINQPDIQNSKSHDTFTNLTDKGYPSSKSRNAYVITADNDKIKKGISDIEIRVYRNNKSYEISVDRQTPKNEKLDSIVLYNKKTKQYVVLDGYQTVANYPNTDVKNNPVDLCYWDTIAPGKFQLKVYTNTNVATGSAGVIINTKTLDGRKVDSNGYTENAKSDGRGLIHSDINPSTGQSYVHAYSKQCFISSSVNNNLFFSTLQNWGVENNSIVNGFVYSVDRRDR